MSNYSSAVQPGSALAVPAHTLGAQQVLSRLNSGAIDGVCNSQLSCCTRIVSWRCILGVYPEQILAVPRVQSTVCNPPGDVVIFMCMYQYNSMCEACDIAACRLAIIASRSFCFTVNIFSKVRVSCSAISLPCTPAMLA